MKRTKLSIIILFSLIAGLLSVSPSLAFTGPSTGQLPGSGSGMISVDPSGNLGFGTNNLNLGTNYNTPPGGTFSKIFTIASSSTPPGINVRNIASSCGTGCGGYSLAPASYVMDITPWGWLEFSDAQNGGARRMFVMNNGYVGVGSAPTTPSALFMVNGGDMRISGNIYSSSSFVGNLSGSISSANVSSGVFGSLQGNGNFAFPVNLGVATSSQNGLPQTLSVYGGGYFSGSVGIGTTSPGARLHVADDGGTGVIVERTNASYLSRWQFIPSQFVAGDFAFKDDLNNKVRQYFDASGGVGIGGNITGATGAGSSLYVKSNGNVGIGTTNPGSILELGNSAVGSNVYETMLSLGVDGARQGIMARNNSYTDTGLAFYTTVGGGAAPTEKVRIDKNGNVGIATTTPNTAKLVVGGAVSGAAIDVAGNSIINVGTPINTGDAANKSYVDSVVGGGGSTGSFTTLTVTGTSTLATTGGNVGIGTTSPTADKLVINGGIDLSGPGAETFITRHSTAFPYGPLTIRFANAPNVNQPGIKFQTWGYPTTQYFDRLIINSDSDTANVAFMNSNVGIGTSTPAGRLDVANGSIVNVGTPINPLDAATKNYVDSAVNPSGGGAGTTGYWTLSGSNLYAASTTYNVGIGTTGPSEKLTINGKIAFVQSAGDEINAGKIDYRSFDSGALSIVGAGASGTRGIRLFDTVGIGYSPSTNSSNVLLVNGNVGIGTTSPGTNLDVNGNIQSSIYYDRDNTNYYMDLAANVMPYSLVTAGSVGIGTTSPGAGLKLDVPGNSYSQFGGLRLNGLDASVNQIWQSNLNTTLGITANGGDISFGQTSGQQMIIKSGGNVGIGTTSPGSYNLNVAGTAYFGNQVTLNGNLNLGSNGITMNQASTAATINGVYKLTVTTIDPLYKIGGTNYATYASAISGGVKEEYVGRATLVPQNPKSQILNPKQCQNSNFKIQNGFGNSDLENCLEFSASNLGFGGTSYQYVLNFNNVPSGSDLWVWRSVVDFSRDNVEVLATAYGVPVPIAYTIDGNKIVFTAFAGGQVSTDGIQFSYRLIGKRYDWKNWPTLSEDQKAESGVIVPVEQ